MDFPKMQALFLTNANNLAMFWQSQTCSTTILATLAITISIGSKINILAKSGLFDAHLGYIDENFINIVVSSCTVSNPGNLIIISILNYHFLFVIVLSSYQLSSYYPKIIVSYHNISIDVIAAQSCRSREKETVFCCQKDTGLRSYIR